MVPVLSVRLQISNHLFGVSSQQLNFPLRASTFKLLLAPGEWKVRSLGRTPSGFESQIVNEVI